MAFILAWWLLPPLLYAGVGSGDTRVKAITDTRTALLAGLVGLGALGTFWLNSRVYRITAQTFEVTERGHVTDRYSKAIEQVGSDSLDVRLGGIYALEQIARDSARAEEDQAIIVEVLSAFVRGHSDPILRYKADMVAGGWKFAKLDEELAEQAANHVAKSTKLPVDVQAAVTGLGRLPPLEKVPRGDLTRASLRHVIVHTDLVRANLTGTDLTRADLKEADLTEADLTGADLTGADLTRTKLAGATLHHAKLAGARLVETDLTGAGLFGADLTKATLTEARLARAGLPETNLTEATFTGTKLPGAILTRANLTRARFFATDLTGAKLAEARLVEARLFTADLTGTDLTKADLTGARLAETGFPAADPTKADLTGAKLAGAILSVIDGLPSDDADETSVRGITQAQLNRARGDHETRLPADLHRPETWDARDAAEAD